MRIRWNQSSISGVSPIGSVIGHLLPLKGTRLLGLMRTSVLEIFGVLGQCSAEANDQKSFAQLGVVVDEGHQGFLRSGRDYSAFSMKKRWSAGARLCLNVAAERTKSLMLRASCSAARRMARAVLR